MQDFQLEVRILKKRNLLRPPKCSEEWGLRGRAIGRAGGCSAEALSQRWLQGCVQKLQYS